MTKFYKYTSLVIVLLITGIIFNFSLQPSVVSDTQSGYFVKIAEWILTLFHNTNYDVLVVTHYVRKLAHFTEYAILGLFIGIHIHTLLKYKKIWYIYIVCIPVIDEVIQLFVEGRSCQLSDMILDLSGELFGILVIYLIFKYCIKRK